MSKNASKSELLAVYEEEADKLRMFARKCGLRDDEIDKIVHESLYSSTFTYVKEMRFAGWLLMLNNCFKKNSFGVLKLPFILLIIVLGLYAATAYERTAVNFVVRNVQELIYPAMKMLRFLSLPLVRQYPYLTAWYDEICLFENPYFQASDMNCWPCEEVRSILDLSETTEPVKYLPHVGFPYIIKGISRKVGLSDVHGMYMSNKQIFDRDASRVISNNKSWNTMEDALNYRLWEKPTYLRTAHITWRINRLEPSRIVRTMFKRPTFIPNTVNVERFILIDEANSPLYSQPLPEGYRVFLMQTSGERLIILEPVPGCSNKCARVSVLLQASDVLYYNSWYYRANSMPITNSSGLSITYIGSY